MAFLGPTSRDSTLAPKPPSNEPTFGPTLAEAGVVGGDRQVADDVEHVAAADRVAGDHRHDRLGQPAHLDVQIGDLEPPDRLVPARGRRVGAGDVAAARSAHALVPARAERVRAFAGQDHDADVEVLAGARERIRQLDHGLRAERVAHLGPVDRDLRDAGVLAAAIS